MLNNVVLGKYYQGKSNIHKFSPILKLLAMLLFIGVVIITKEWFVLALCSILLLVLILDTRIPYKYYYKALENIVLLLLVILIIGLFTGADRYLLAVSVMKIVLIVLYSSMFIYTTTNVGINHGLNQLLKPLNWLGVKTNAFILMLSLSIRYIPTVLIEANKIYKSQASRGVDFKHSSLKGKIEAIKSMIIPMFALSIRRADKLAEAMELRLYNIESGRTNFRVYKWHIYDIVVFFIHVLILILMIKKVGF